MPKRKHNINKTLAMTLIFSGAMLIIIAFVLIRLETLLGWIGSLLGILRPVFIGIVLTFVLYGPVVRITHFLEKAAKGRRFPCNGVAVLLSYLFFFGILTGLIWIVVPSFISSIEEFTDKFSTYVVNIQNWLDNIMNFFRNDRGGNLLEKLDINSKDIIAQISNIASKIPDYMPDVMGKIGKWASGFAGVITDIVLGIVFSIYILAGRSRLKKQARRILKTFLSQTSYDRIIHYSALTFNTFSNFVSGQLMEALIMGLLCFIGMTILGFPYAIMISVIVGVTNIIPIIGPIIGTIPGAIIYLMIDPWKAIWFVVFIIVVQQIDGNLIYPRVVGSSVGLPAIWILFAVTVGGGLFGVIGMVVGVPLMSLIYTILREKTAAAADGSDNSGNPGNKDKPMIFPAVGQKTSALFSRLKQSVHNGMSAVMDKVDERIHRKDSEEQSDNENADNAQSDTDIEDNEEDSAISKALEDFEKAEESEG